MDYVSKQIQTKIYFVLYLSKSYVNFHKRGSLDPEKPIKLHRHISSLKTVDVTSKVLL